jgi:hypothetical protein
MSRYHTKISSKYDDYMTPKSAWEAIISYIPRNLVVWEAFYGDGQSGRYLTELGLNVIHEKDLDFFQENKGDIIISNPPFTLKRQVLERLKTLDKPFILLCPIGMLLTNYFRNLFGEECQFIIPRKRIQFIKIENGVPHYDQRCNFDCCYFCYKLNLEKDVIFLT